MAVAYKVCIDCADAHKLATFWAQALDYVVEDNSRLIDQLLADGVITDDHLADFEGRKTFKDAVAIRDPDHPVHPFTGVGQGGRVLFQVVPEPKTAKNRVHLDLHTGGERDARVERLVEAGGTVQGEFAENGSAWIVMTDPEGNEFCVN